MNKIDYNENDLINELLKNKPHFDLNVLNSNEETFLHLCAKKGCNDALLWLIGKKVLLNYENNEGNTAIFYAIVSSKESTIEILKKSGANINHLNKQNRTILQETIARKKFRLVDYLLKNVRNLNNCDIFGNNLIFDAVKSENIELIKKVASINYVNNNQKDSENRTVLFLPQVSKNKEISKLLLSFNIDPLLCDNKNKNFLFYLVSEGIKNIEIIDKVINLGTNINSVNNRGETVLFEIVSHIKKTKKHERKKINSFLLLIKELLNKGIDINIENEKKETVLYRAVKTENKDLLHILIKNKSININHKNIYKETALFILVHNWLKNLELIIDFLNNKANPNLKDSHGQSAIEILIDIITHIHNNKKSFSIIRNKIFDKAGYIPVLEEILNTSTVDLKQLNSRAEPLFFKVIAYYNFQLLKILVNNGININQKDNKGKNIVFYLIEKNKNIADEENEMYINTLRYLLSLDIDINEKDNNQDTILQIASKQSASDILVLILEANADIQIKDKKERTVMHNVVIHSQTSHLKHIHSLNNRIINICDCFGLSPLDYAVFLGKEELVIELINLGAKVENNNNKNLDILNLLINYKQNLLKIEKIGEEHISKKDLNLLIDNMKKEFF